jgi:hypothetical protein
VASVALSRGGWAQATPERNQFYLVLEAGVLQSTFVTGIHVEGTTQSIVRPVAELLVGFSGGTTTIVTAGLLLGLPRAPVQRISPYAGGTVGFLWATSRQAAAIAVTTWGRAGIEIPLGSRRMAVRVEGRVLALPAFEGEPGAFAFVVGLRIP